MSTGTLTLLSLGPLSSPVSVTWEEFIPRVSGPGLTCYILFSCTQSIIDFFLFDEHTKADSKLCNYPCLLSMSPLYGSVLQHSQSFYATLVSSSDMPSYLSLLPLFRSPSLPASGSTNAEQVSPKYSSSLSLLRVWGFESLSEPGHLQEKKPF